MPIHVNLDVMLAKRKIKLYNLSAKIGITPQNLSILKTGKARAIRLETLEAICRHLDCQPGDILEYVEAQGDENENTCTQKSFFPRFSHYNCNAFRLCRQRNARPTSQS
jgi:putative transcriptional regulator